MRVRKLSGLGNQQQSPEKGNAQRLSERSTPQAIGGGSGRENDIVCTCWKQQAVHKRTAQEQRPCVNKKPIDNSNKNVL